MPFEDRGSKLLPASAEAAPCGDTDEIEVDVDLALATDGPYLVLPAYGEAKEWEIRATLFFGPHRVRWTQTAPTESTTALELPEAALVDRAQVDWLSRVEVKVYAAGSPGHPGGRKRLPPVWVVWDAGTDQAPRWLDDAAKSAEAPTGAWTDRSVVATGDEILEIEPELGGAP